MDERTQLMELIEHERRYLDEVVDLGLDSDEVFAQSKKLDLLINEYYNAK